MIIYPNEPTTGYIYLERNELLRLAKYLSARGPASFRHYGREILEGLGELGQRAKQLHRPMERLVIESNLHSYKPPKHELEQRYAETRAGIEQGLDVFFDDLQELTIAEERERAGIPTDQEKLDHLDELRKRKEREQAKKLREKLKQEISG